MLAPALEVKPVAQAVQLDAPRPLEGAAAYKPAAHAVQLVGSVVAE